MSPTLGAAVSTANERRIMLSLITQNKSWSRIQLVLVQISVIGGLIDRARVLLEKPFAYYLYVNVKD